MQAERANLLSVARLVVRDVIQYASGKQRIFIDNYNFSQSSDDSTDSAVQAVYRLLAVIEHCLCHGLRRDLPVTELPPSSRTSRLSLSKDVILNSSSVLRRAKDQVVLKASSLITPPSEPNPWPVLLHIEQLIPALEEMSKSILTMSTVRTGLGRSRVWICQALMRKQLANYLQRLIDEVDEPITGTQKSDLNADEHPAVLDGLQPSSFYTSEAMLINDEGVVFVGLLVGLSSIDFCFVLKDNLKELDCGLHAIPYSTYLPSNFDQLDRLFNKDNSYANVDLSSVVEQKVFLEELNSKLQKRLDAATAKQNAQDNQIKSLAKSLEATQLENQSLRIVLAQLKKGKPVGIPNGSEVHKKNGVTTEGDDEQLQNIQEELKHANMTIDEKNILVRSLRAELLEAQTLNGQMKQKLSSTQTLLDQKQLLIRQLEGKARGMSNIIDQMKERVTTLSTEKSSVDRTLTQIQSQAAELKTRCTKQEADLRVKHEVVRTLEHQVDEKVAEINRLQTLVAELAACKVKIEELKTAVDVWRTRCEEQEGSLCEMAAVVSSSKLEADHLRESHTALKDAQWTEDSAALYCHKCQAPFSISRRRHHCRNCGLIFCHNCSSQTMPLPSAAKPVRVCDACHALLLHRYSAK